MAIDFLGATLTFGGSSVGTVVGFAIPANQVKKREDTGLLDTREVFSKMAMSVAQQFNYTIRLNPEARPVKKGDSGQFVITLPKQDPASTVQMSHTFSGFVEIEGEVSGDVGTSEGVTQEFTVQLTTENVIVLES